MRKPHPSRMLRVLATSGLLAAGFFLNSAHAGVSVHVIQNDPDSGDASIVPSSTLPSADFTSPVIDFEIDNSDSQTLATFLNNPVFTNQRNGFDASQMADNTFLEITGSAYLVAGDNAFVVGHDDGVVLAFADPAIGIVVNEPGPTGLVQTPFNVNVATAGLYAFDLKYTECCGGPADLIFTVNGSPPVPEPASYTLLLAGLALTGGILGRRGRSRDA